MSILRSYPMEDFMGEDLQIAGRIRLSEEIIGPAMRGIHVRRVLVYGSYGKRRSSGAALVCQTNAMPLGIPITVVGQAI